MSVPRPGRTALATAVSFVCLVAARADQRTAPDPSAALRRAIEPAYRQQTGLGFRSFRCPVERPLGPGDYIDCDAVDDEGDELRYTLKVDEKGEAEVVLISQSASSIPAGDTAALEPPCRAFLEAYGRAETCRASLAGGGRLAITIARRGGQHRIVREEPLAR